MPAFAATYSRKQKETLYREAIDNARPISQVLRDARAGELDGLEPAEQASLGAMSNAWAGTLVKEERMKRAGKTRTRRDPRPEARELVRRLLARAEVEVSRIEKLRGKPMDTGAAIAVAKLLRELGAVARDLDAVPKGAPVKGGAASTPEPQSLAERIAAAAQAPEQSDLTTTTAVHPGDAGALRAGEQAADTDDVSGGAVRQRAASSDAESAAPVLRAGGPDRRTDRRNGG